MKRPIEKRSNGNEKLVTILMALLMCVIISAALSEIPSEAEFLELNQKIWEANIFDNVLSRHESYTIHWTYDYFSSDQFVYQTKEGYYSEWSFGDMEYIRPDRFGCSAYIDDDSGIADIETFVDVGPDAVIHVQNSTDEEKDSF